MGGDGRAGPGVRHRSLARSLRQLDRIALRIDEPPLDRPSDGKEIRADFPAITPSDLARGHKKLLEALGLERVRAVVGASLGGMQALQFAAEYPEAVDRFLVLSTTARTTPHTVALRRIGRQAILLDPEYRGGWYEAGKGPRAGLKLAREIGTILYRSRDEFNARFSHTPIGGFSPADKTFEVESYLAAHGERFAPKFDANCYLLLSKCMDLMDLGFGQPSLEAGILRIEAKGLIIGVDRDALTPIDEQKRLAEIFAAARRDVRFEALSVSLRPRRVPQGIRLADAALPGVLRRVKSRRYRTAITTAATTESGPKSR